ncbi:FAD linked oxidase domain protein [[Leptolyngbya] sp. PCC 7376]|uniref:FAD-binding oxidoreductase n=1 Tax=[Leptolyngbya] sp. PCC 7376 TaxID=111781 RepID=UPI00029F37A7|nr:FAD-binding oxidoreductase [[Leptolyngbya] sp. PCC 7376]AFY40424.1 FAD linked oxidase domain protein [[Leptolyngbya] sp. PCC 7376]
MTLTAAPDIDIKQWQDCHPRWHETFQRVSRLEPEALLVPHNQGALCRIIQDAQQKQKRLIPCGNGTKLAWGGVAKQIDWLVSTQKLNRIVDHAVDDLTITVEAGVTLKTLQTHLRQHNQFLPFDPAFPDEATMGGIVATANAGSWRQRYGGVKDLLLGITVVRADGQLAKAGGKVVKNVAGYDLMKLFTGSYGSLAIATELTFRLYPQQQLIKTVLLTGNQTQIDTAQRRLLNSVLTPSRADLLAPALMQKLDLTENFGMLVRFAAIPESVDAQIAELGAIANDCGLGIEHHPETLWDTLTEQIYSYPVSCKIGLLPHQACNFLATVERLTDGQAIASIHCKSGLGLVAFPHEKFLRQFQDLRRYCEQHQGFLTMLDAPYSTKIQFDPWGYGGNALPLMKKIKAQFDPQQLFSPGRFVGGI